MIGRVIGNYRITSELASGGMGEVFRGQHLHLPREVVVKSILLGAFSPSSQQHLKARFRREAYIQSQLDHPNIVRVYEFFTLEDNYYLVMEYVPGLSLKDFLLRHGRPTVPQSLLLLKQALAALNYSHNFSYLDESEERHTGIIHRDIKPANLLLDTRGRLKITDFGIVKATGDEELTQSGFQPGTIEYMSPEQLLGHEVDARTDLYCLGATFFEVLTGQLPFPRSSTGSDWEVRKGHIEKEPPSLIEIRSEIPDELNEIILRSLRKDPGERFQTAAEFFDAVRKFETGNAQIEIVEGREESTRIVLNLPTHSERSPARAVERSPGIDNFSTALKDPLEEAITIPLSGLSGPAAENSPEPETLVRTASDSREVYISVPAAMGGRRWPVIAAITGALAVGLAGGAYFFSARNGAESGGKAPAASPSAQPSAAFTAVQSPHSPAKPARTQAPENGLLKSARQLEERENYSEAIRKYEEYRQRSPNAPDSKVIGDRIATLRQFQGLMTAAAVSMDLRKYALARQQYTEALKIRPESEQARVGLKEAEGRITNMQFRQGVSPPAGRPPRPLDSQSSPDSVAPQPAVPPQRRRPRDLQIFRRKKVEGPPLEPKPPA